MTGNSLTHTSMAELHPIISESIRDGGQFVFYPSGISMLPTIKEKEDCVVLAEAENLQKYDMILYLRDNGHYVLHRIMSIKNGQYTLCGDNQYRYEYGIRHDQIIAMAVEIRKKNGSIISLSDIRAYKPTLFISLRRASKCFRLFAGRIYRKIFKRK